MLKANERNSSVVACFGWASSGLQDLVSWFSKAAVCWKRDLGPHVSVELSADVFEVCLHWLGAGLYFCPL